MGKSSKQKTTTSVDPNTQRYVNQMRQQAQTGAQNIVGGQYFGGPSQTFMQGVSTLQNPTEAARAFYNPYQQQVVDAVGQDFARQRQAALTMGAQEATKAGAYGGSRSGILQAQALRDVDQNAASTLANLRYSGYNNALNNAFQQGQGLLSAGYTQGGLEDQRRQNDVWALNQAMGVQNLGMGPYGTTTEGQQKNPWYNDVFKGAAAAGSLFSPIKL